MSSPYLLRAFLEGHRKGSTGIEALLAPVPYDLGMMLNPAAADIPWAVIELALLALPVIGLLVVGAWIIRIARGTGDESANWRYRNRK